MYSSKNSNEKYCVINVYAPTQGKVNSMNSAKLCLDLIHELIEKYGKNNNLIIAGDFNMSLTRFKLADKLLQQFIKEHELVGPGPLPRIPTYTSHSECHSSQIDYIFTTHGEYFANDYTIDRKDCINTSSHTLVSASFKGKLKFPAKCSSMKV